MRVAIHQPNFLPWMGFFYKASQSDLFVLLDNVQFIKRGFIQRNYVKGPTGKQRFGVPVTTKGRYDQTIAEAEISYENPWQAKAVATLRHLYAKAPAYDSRAPEIVAALTSQHARLVDLNIKLLTTVFPMLGINTPIVRASELDGVVGTSTNRLMSICHAVSAQEYLSGTGGQNYQDEQAFAAAGIRLVYSEFEQPVYPQLHGGFVPQLSILDFLFNVQRVETAFTNRVMAA